MTQLASPSSPPPPAPATAAFGGQHPLVSRITRLRARVRAAVGLFGFAILLAAAVGGIFVLMFGDYLIHIPASLRLILLLAWVTALGVLVWRFIIAPLSTRLTDQFLASRVENRHPDLADELMSAIHFIHHRAAAGNVLAARQIEQASRKATGIPFEEAVDFRRGIKALAIALLIALLAGVVGGLNPQLTRIAWSRWFTAYPIAWPHTTRVAFDWSAYGGQPPSVLPLGEKIMLRAKVDRGAMPYVRLYSWTDKDPATVTQLMTFQKEQSTSSEFIFESSLEPEGSTLNIRIEAGDDVEQSPIPLQLRPRPIMSELTAAITPPPYVKNPSDPTKPAPAVQVDLLSQAGRAVEGATIALRVRASKPFRLETSNGASASDPAGAPSAIPDIRFFDQNKDEEIRFSFTRRLLEPSLAELDFPASKTLQARLVMRDADGFENRVGGALGIEVVPDALPSIVITDPRRTVERSPTGFVDIALQATDDLGLDGLKLRADKFDAKPGDPPVFEAALPWQDRTVNPAVGNTTGKAQYTWDLTPLHLQPGARLTVYAMVQDNYDVNGKRHDWVKSAPLSLQIRSAADIAESARHGLNEIKDRLKSLRGQQEQTRSLTDAIQKAVAASNVTTLQQKTQLSDLAQQESQEAAAANSVQQRAAQIAEDLRQNNMGMGDLGQLAQEVSAGMQTVGQDNMPKAAGELNKAQESAGNRSDAEKAKVEAKQAASAMTGATGQQGTAIATMDNLISRLGAAGDFEALKARVADIAAKQQQISNDTRKLAPQTIGRNLSELPKELRDKLADLSHRQDDLHNQTADAIEQMNKTAQQLNQSDPAAAQSLQKAAEAGTQANVSNAQSDAGNNVASNQLNDASNNQGQAQRGLQQMLDELNKNDRRQLEQLARQLRALLEEVKKLRADQDAIHTDTVAAGAAAASGPMQKLGDRQGTLQQNTIIIQKKAENTQRAKEAAVDIHDAADAMSTAAGALYGSKQPESLEPETKAIASLDEAIKKLEAAAKRTEAEAKDKDLADYIKQYEAIKTDQIAVKGGTDKIETKRQAAVDKQVDRMDSIKLGELARTQGGLSDRIAQLSSDDKLKPFDVVIWMNGQIVGLMNDSRERLTKVQLGPQVASSQQGSIDRIQMIVDALKEEQKRNNDFNKPSGGGGGGGGKPPLVPPLAQLKLLKSMQTVVNSETATVNHNLTAAANDPEKSEFLTASQKLGQTQGEIKNIADKLSKELAR